MGLDITAYNRLTYLNPQPNDEEAEDLEAKQLYNAGFDRLSPQPEGYYTQDESGSSLRIACGAYSRYNRWREALARLAGWPLSEYEQYGSKWPSHAASAWNASAGPFWELINFNDNEGAIGYVASAKLAKDFADYRPGIAERAALMNDQGYFMEKYDEWAAAFALAADGGAVDFH